MTGSFVLTLSCPEQPGIVHAVTTVLNDNGCDITEHQQFDDPMNGNLFLRTAFDAPRTGVRGRAASRVRRGRRHFRHDLAAGRRRHCTRILLMVSKFDHCLTDLLYRWRAGCLGGQVAVVVSNHQDLAHLADTAGVPFVHIPVTADSKADAEARLLQVVDEQRIDLVVLARYMQVLSDTCVGPCAAGRSTSTTRSCPASPAPSLTTRPTSGASSTSVRPRITSPRNSTRVRSSSRNSPVSTTATPPRT